MLKKIQIQTKLTEKLKNFFNIKVDNAIKDEQAAKEDDIFRGRSLFLFDTQSPLIQKIKSIVLSN